MFSLLSGCFEFMLRKEELHILIVGLDKAGKTTLLERLKTLYTDVPGLEADKVLPTVGLNLAHFEVGTAWWRRPTAQGRRGGGCRGGFGRGACGDRPASEPGGLPSPPLPSRSFSCPQALGTPLLCWDVGGASGLRGIWSKYYGECHALVFVVDAADRQRLEEAKLALDRALGGGGHMQRGGRRQACPGTSVATVRAECS